MLGGAASASAELVDVPELGVRLERGFRITQISDEQLANDIWCMTLNPRDEIVVSGPGYISTLLDGKDERRREAGPGGEICGLERRDGAVL